MEANTCISVSQLHKSASDRHLVQPSTGAQRCQRTSTSHVMPFSPHKFSMSCVSLMPPIRLPPMQSLRTQAFLNILPGASILWAKNHPGLSRASVTTRRDSHQGIFGMLSFNNVEDQTRMKRELPSYLVVKEESQQQAFPHKTLC